MLFQVGPIAIRKVDLAALIFMPVTFAVFNLYYWLTAGIDRDYPGSD